MADSSRPRAPRSAVSDSSIPSLSNHRPLMPLADVREALSGVEGSLDALLVLLRAAGGAFINTDHIEALLAPIHERLNVATDSLIDLPLIEQPANALPVLESAAPAPEGDRFALSVIKPDLGGVQGAVVTGYYFNRIGDGHMHAFGCYEDGYFLYDEHGIDVWGTFEAMAPLLDKKMGGAA